MYMYSTDARIMTVTNSRYTLNFVNTRNGSSSRIIRKQYPLGIRYPPLISSSINDTTLCYPSGSKCYVSLSPISSLFVDSNQ